MSGKIIAEIKSLLLPVVVAIMGWLIKDKLDGIEKRLSSIPQLQISQAETIKVVESVEKRVDRIESDLNSHIRLEGKHEEEYKIPKRR